MNTQQPPQSPYPPQPPRGTPYGPAYPQMPPQYSKPAKTNPWPIILIVGAAVALFGAAIICAGTMGSMSSFDASGKGKFEVLDEGSNGLKVMVIPIKGIIGAGDMISPSAGVSIPGIKNYISMVQDDEKYVGILLDIDSPGGSVYSSDEIYHMLKELGEDAGIDIYAHFRGMSASGGYYIGCSADKIYADPTCITGSIGVIVQTLNFSGLMEKMGVSVETIKSGEVKDMMSPYKPMSEAEREIMKSIVDEYYERFVGIVAEARKMTIEEAKTVGDARIYTATQAFEVGLVDAVARVNEVYADIRNDLGDVSFVTWQPLPTFMQMLGGYQAHSELRNALKLLPNGNTPVFMYMWNGGVAPFAVSAPLVVESVGAPAQGQEEK